MAITTNASAQDVQDKRTEEKWDKVFPLSETVADLPSAHSFHEYFCIPLAR